MSLRLAASVTVVALALALPDNCQVAIDGTFVDYPPILNKAVAAGTHVVSFTWPDGKKAQESVEVTSGAAAFVTGRKD